MTASRYVSNHRARTRVRREFVIIRIHCGVRAADTWQASFRKYAFFMSRVSCSGDTRSEAESAKANRARLGTRARNFTRESMGS